MTNRICKLVKPATSADSAVTLSVITLPNQPVTLLSYGGANFGINGNQVITVPADAAGLAEVTANAQRLGSSPVLANSPVMSGTVKFSVVGK